MGRHIRKAHVGIPLSSKEKAILENIAESLHLSVATFVRGLILKDMERRGFTYSADELANTDYDLKVRDKE